MKIQKNSVDRCGKELELEFVTEELKPTVTDEKPELKSKPSVSELILQGLTKDEIIKITGCKPGTYYQTKSYLKKKGLLMNIKVKQELDENGKAKTYKCSKVGDTCFYRVGCGQDKICDYIGVEKHRRGCHPEQCDKFRKK